MIASALHHAEWLDFRHLLFRFCVFISMNALLANLLPRAKHLARWPLLQCWYEVLIALIAIFSLNWRACLPSLDIEFMGCRALPGSKPVPHLRERIRRRRLLRR